MDTSETYVKMRIKAIPDLGRGKPLEETFRSENYYVLENDEYSVFISRNGNWYTFHPAIEMSEQGRTCQLERQDELQEMLTFSVGSFKDNFWSALADLYDWSFGTKGAKFLDYIPESMEQLWLAFVMQSLYQKSWNEEDWVE